MSLSNCLQIRSKDTSRLPVTSPAATMWIRISGNTFPSAFMALARESPFSTEVVTLLRDFFNVLFSVWSVTMCRPSMRVTPAFKILWNCLQKIVISFFFTGLPMVIFHFASSMEADSWISMTTPPSAVSLATACSWLGDSTTPLFCLPYLSVRTYLNRAIW